MTLKVPKGERPDENGRLPYVSCIFEVRLLCGNVVMARGINDFRVILRLGIEHSLARCRSDFV